MNIKHSFGSTVAFAGAWQGGFCPNGYSLYRANPELDSMIFIVHFYLLDHSDINEEGC